MFAEYLNVQLVSKFIFFEVATFSVLGFLSMFA
jgi:hypothetical protein